MKYLKNCKHCQEEFKTYKQDKDFCSSYHKLAYYRKLNPNPKTKHICENCGTQFGSNRKNVRACSLKCIIKLNNKRTTEKKQVENEEKFKNVEDIPTCKICGYKSRSLHTHLINHNLTVSQYKKKYNVDKNAIFHTSYLDALSVAILGDKNPAWQHDGKFSPYSTKFVKYEKLSKDDKENAIKLIVDKSNNTRNENENCTTRISYYLKQGLSEEEAHKALSDRQKTFSKAICIEKYGKEKGLKRWKDRQEKWLKSYPKSNYSKISQELFKSIYVLLPNDLECFFANIRTDDRNDEYILKTHKSFVKPDFYIPVLCKIIEFDGDYWHSEKQAGVGKTRDSIRDYDILNKYPDMDILHIKEQDYRKNKQRIVKKCLKFLQV